MIDGDPREFIDGLHYGDERFFLFDGHKYFIQGYVENGRHILIMHILEAGSTFTWKVSSDTGKYPVRRFETEKVFNGKPFWEIEKEITWTDC
ncbi:MAG: hypothetical protein HUJ54_12790 [Erysipelotrichaceae bacterium]|nr:hypothetical protein [Erysipelotrichaceae bacterium]